MTANNNSLHLTLQPTFEELRVSAKKRRKGGGII